MGNKLANALAVMISKDENIGHIPRTKKLSVF